MQSPFALIIEDDVDAATIFAKALETINVHCEFARAGDIALSMLATLVPNLIILDMHLPYADGPEILTFIRNQEQLVSVPVMIVTADPRMAEMIQHKADLVLLKPASFMQIRDFASRLLRRAAMSMASD